MNLCGLTSHGSTCSRPTGHSAACYDESTHVTFQDGWWADDRTALRLHHVIDIVEAALARHKGTHPSRTPDCEMCDMRGEIAWDGLMDSHASETPEQPLRGR